MSNTPDLHCTAFLVIQGELNEVAVDYCLDHYYHSDGFKDGGSAEKQAESFTPEDLPWITEAVKNAIIRVTFSGQTATRALVQQLAKEDPGAKSSEGAEDLYLSQYVTKRENFPNAETYHAVLQFEMTCNMLRERMQYSRGVNVVNHYLDKLTAILEDVMADPLCAPSRAQNRALLREEQAANDEAVISNEVSERGCDVASPSTASEVNFYHNN
ncbi:unnamed protein product [Nippostrongylus brasiliensis]|uniref:Dynamin_M domain-containing protein n=1 Tax=Nippostrongylus brasiliensis TaxID=27835 RepID=A0A0N4YYT0_NIPBR|nr:unnamed protein product [Nippostrongylus brasiliensis]